MHYSENEVICLSPETKNLKMLCFITHNVPSHKNLERSQSDFGSLLWVYFSKKLVCRFFLSYVLACRALLYYNLNIRGPRLRNF